MNKYKISSNAGWIIASIPILFFLFILFITGIISISAYHLYMHTFYSLDKTSLVLLMILAALSWFAFKLIQNKGAIIEASEDNLEINCNGSLYNVKWNEITKIRHIIFKIFSIKLKNGNSGRSHSK